MIRGLIFDFDGLILDTEMPVFQAWQELYAEHGCAFPFDAWSAALGGSGTEFDACAYLEAQIGRALDQASLHARRRRRRQELLAAQTVLPGVADYLASARRLGLRVGLASSSPRAWVEEHLGRLALLDHFECVSCAEDVPRVKPDPALFLRTLDALDLRPREAIVFEDSPNGIAAAKAAGIFCVAVPNPLTARLSIDHADLRLTSLAELPLETLLARIGPSRTSRPRPLPS